MSSRRANNSIDSHQKIKLSANTYLLFVLFSFRNLNIYLHLCCGNSIFSLGDLYSNTLNQCHQYSIFRDISFDEKILEMEVNKRIIGWTQRK